jgi:hypothetical protein
MDTRIAGQLLLESSATAQRHGRYIKSLNTHDLGSAIHLLHLTIELENADNGMVLKRLDVIGEMHRLAQRQFHWQRGMRDAISATTLSGLVPIPSPTGHSRHCPWLLCLDCLCRWCGLSGRPPAFVLGVHEPNGARDLQRVRRCRRSREWLRESAH